MRVFLHTRSEGKTDWKNENRDFARIPNTGEHLSLSSDSPWYEVQLVVHTPFDTDIEAEVYAVEVDHLEVMKRTLPDLD